MTILLSWLLAVLDIERSSLRHRDGTSIALSTCLIAHSGVRSSMGREGLLNDILSFALVVLPPIVTVRRQLIAHTRPRVVSIVGKDHE